jgi:hypothetical protein
MPDPTAMMRKNTGNDSDSAASACMESIPANHVSTTLYMVLKKNPMLAGMAIRRINCGKGSYVKYNAPPLQEPAAGPPTAKRQAHTPPRAPGEP